MNRRNQLSRVKGAAIFWFCALCSSFIGCQNGPITDPEHDTPAHKPQDFPAAVDRLIALHAEIDHGGSRPPGKIDVFTESYDVARWLPDLAADSDLEEQPWNQVHVTARQLEAILVSVLAQAEGMRRETYLKYEQQLTRHQRELVAVKQQYPTPNDVAAD